MLNKKYNAFVLVAVPYLTSMTALVKSADDDYSVSSSCSAVLYTQN